MVLISILDINYYIFHNILDLNHYNILHQLNLYYMVYFVYYSFDIIGYPYMYDLILRLYFLK